MTVMSTETVQEEVMQSSSKKGAPRVQIVWRNVFIFLYLHAAALYGAYLMFFRANLMTGVWAFLLYILSGWGITAGAHRLWAHRSYKARFPARLFLAFCNSLAFQNSIYEWARDHRVHHKFSETDADPHNATRGFFFAHMGWLLCKKHPDVKEKGKVVDMSDLLEDPIVRIQKKFYLQSVIVVCFIFPMMVPHYFWGETYWNAFFVASILRYCWTLHCTWLVNSAAHLWGDRPYDEKINPSENPSVILLSLGEGYHNYHHTFPWDYATSEWGWRYNSTTFLINTWAKLGLAYNLKKVPQKVVNGRRANKGDGSKPWFEMPHTEIEESSLDD